MKYVSLVSGLVVTLFIAAPAAAQSDRLTLRPYALITEQAFSAQTTFNALFGQSAQPFWGAGAQLILRRNIFVDVSASRFKKTGQRAFLDNGKITRLKDIDDTVTITPFEIAGGYRFRWRRHPTMIPFVGAGIGWYSYREEASFALPGDNVDEVHVGALINGGVEFRVHRWIALSVDAQYTHIPGILGTAETALSKAAGENDLGGIAGRFKFIVGR